MQISQAAVRTGYEEVQAVLENSKRGGAKKSEEGEPSLTSAQAAERINRSNWRWIDSNNNGITELTYHFSTTMPRVSAENQLDLSAGKVNRVIPLTLGQKEHIRKAHQEYADVANVTFTEKADGGEGHLTYRGYSTDDQATSNRGFAYYPDPKETDPDRQGAVWIRNLDQTSKFGNWADEDKSTLGEDFWRSSLIHEQGHALGLEHPDSEEPATPDYIENWKNYTLMSHNIPELNDTQDTVMPVSLMIDDIAAIQSKYGANRSTRSGNTTYGFNSNTERDQYSLKTAQDKPLFAVWDGGGWDTLDFSEFSQPQKINLNAGSFSSVGGLRANVAIANGVTIEEARGGKGKNTLIGNEVFNRLRGGPDEDILYGGSGGAQMWGGKGGDTFVFDTTSSGKPNWVMDFVSGQDKLDLSGLRQQLGKLNFFSRLPLDHSKAQDPLNPTYISKPGDVLVSYDRNRQLTLLRVNINGDGKMDMHIHVHGKVVRKDVVV